MAEERDPLTAPDTGSASGASTPRAGDPNEIEKEIRETRAEMSETLDAIGARFQPDYIKEQAKDALRSTARDAGTTMLDTIKANPIPSLIAGLSIGWLIAKGGQPDGGRYDRDYEEDYRRRYGRSPDYRGYRSYGESYGYNRYNTGYREQNADGGESLKDKATDAVGDAKHKVSDLANQAGDQFHEMGDDVQRYGRQATNWLEHQMDANPLAVGAVALAAGALVGLAVPGTQKEDELMGRASERLTEKAKDVAEEKLDQVKAVAKETADEAKEKAREVADTAKEEAKSQGLTSPGDAAKSGSTSGSTPSGGSVSGSTAGSTGTGSKRGTGAQSGNR